MKERLPREIVAMRVAREFFDGAVVNLGIGIPTLASSYVPEGREVIYHTENGCLGFGPVLTTDGAHLADIYLVNAGGQFVRALPGMSFCDQAASFAMARGGHLDFSVLGALQVSEKGDLANWFLPERGIGNIGGGMDLAVGARCVIVAMEHTSPHGAPKVVRECSYPPTARGCVDLIVTDLAVIQVTPRGLVLKELAPGWTAAEVQAITEPTLIVAPDLTEITL